MKTNKIDFCFNNLSSYIPALEKHSFRIASSAIYLGLGVLSRRSFFMRNALAFNIIRSDNLLYAQRSKIECLDINSIFRKIKGFENELDIKTPTIEVPVQPQTSPENETLLSIFKNDVLANQEVVVVRQGEKFQVALSNKDSDKKGLPSQFVVDLLKMVGLEAYAGIAGAVSVTVNCPKVFEFVSRCTEEGTAIKFTDSTKMLSYEAKIGKGLFSLDRKYAIEEILLTKNGEVSVKVALVNKDGSLTDSFPNSFGKVEGSSCPKIATFCSQIWS